MLALAFLAIATVASPRHGFYSENGNAKLGSLPLTLATPHFLLGMTILKLEQKRRQHLYGVGAYRRASLCLPFGCTSVQGSGH